jgi:rhamnosyltransferase subunit B
VLRAGGGLFRRPPRCEHYERLEVDMRILLAPAGSHGDVHPFVGLGVALKARGHEVHLLTADHFRHHAADNGFDDFAATMSEADFQTMTNDPLLWHPRRGLEAVFNPAIIRPAIRRTYALIAERYTPGETVVLAGALSHAARLANEKLGVPLATIHLQPMALYSVEDPARYAAFVGIRRWPRFALRGFYRVGDFLIDRITGPVLNEFRQELGLPRVKRLYSTWVNSPQRILGLFPEWYGSAPDWPPQTRVTGFVRYDQATGGVPPEVEDFLSSGEPPIVFTFGSAMRQGAELFRVSVEACKLLGKRGLLLARGKEQIPADLPPNVMHAEYAPFSNVFSRAAAVVHHGGIGTCAQGLAAGVPQLVVPLAFDQPDNAERLEKLGVGRWIARRKFTPKRAARVLKELLAMPREACERWAKKMAEGDPLREACEAIEGLRGRDL